jgi:hypothetical protein
MYKGSFAAKSWDYTDLVDYLRTDEGTVHIASLVMVRARQLFDTNWNENGLLVDCLR